MVSEFTMTQINLPNSQRDYCKQRGLTYTEAYIEAFQNYWMEGNAKIKRREELKLEIKRLDEEIEKIKNKPYTPEENYYLKISIDSVNAGGPKLDVRFNGFKRKYSRDFMTLDEFITEVKRLNGVKK